MACYRPIIAYQPPLGDVNPKTGDRRITFSPPPGWRVRGWKEITVPCGQCIGCRLDKTASWALRCLHESRLWPCNTFVTLTFNDDNLNPDMSLHKEDFVNFMKRLRIYFERKYDNKIRFFHCGEYGEKNLRPHHHAILFNCDFPDKTIWKQSPIGAHIYRSAILESLWPYGFSTIGSVTYQSCGYVARYCLKKVTGKNSADYYKGRIPPYITMSRRPGIGREWIETYWRDVYPNDFCVTANGFLRKPPRYYDQIYDFLVTNIVDESVATIDEIKLLREQRSKELDSRQYEDLYDKYERLEVKEFIKSKKIESLRRDI